MQFDRLKRREFISLLGGAAVGWPLSARAQQPDNRPTIGSLGTATASAWRPYVAAFEQRLRELGWADGRTVAIEYRCADGHSARFNGISARFVRLKVDLVPPSAHATP